MKNILNFASSVFASSLLYGCAATLPVYSEPMPLGEKAFVKFALNSPFPITVGEIVINEGEVKCETMLNSRKKLFVRARGNPLISDENLAGVWLPAGRTVFLAARAITSAEHSCAIAGNFTPRSGVQYELRLGQSGTPFARDLCTLEVFDTSNPTMPLEDLTILKCEAKSAS